MMMYVRVSLEDSWLFDICMTGVYKCRCEQKIEKKTFCRYNLTAYSVECSMKTVFQGKSTLCHGSNHLKSTLATVESNINDMLTVTCITDGEKYTNCSELDHPLHDIPLRLSDTRCQFSCVVTADNAMCQVIIMLNVSEELHQTIQPNVESTIPTTEILTSTLDSDLETESFNEIDAINSLITTTELEGLQPSVLDTDMMSPISTTMDLSSTMDSSAALETSNGIYTINTLIATSEVEGMPSQIGHSNTIHEGYTSSSKVLTTLMWTSSRTQNVIETNMKNGNSVQPNKSVIYLGIVISILTFIVIVQFVWIIARPTRYTFRVNSSSNEIWLNPVYESADTSPTSQSETENRHDIVRSWATLVPNRNCCVSDKSPASERRSVVLNFSDIDEFDQYAALKTDNHGQDKTIDAKSENFAVNYSVPRPIAYKDTLKTMELKSKEEIVDGCSSIGYSVLKKTGLYDERVTDNGSQCTSVHIYDEVKLFE